MAYFTKVSSCGLARFDTFVSDADGDLYKIMGAVAARLQDHGGAKACNTRAKETVSNPSAAK
eukprot:3710125-Prorocentrum_lima.AAC.1